MVFQFFVVITMVIDARVIYSFDLDFQFFVVITFNTTKYNYYYNETSFNSLLLLPQNRSMESETNSHRTFNSLLLLLLLALLIHVFLFYLHFQFFVVITDIEFIPVIQLRRNTFNSLLLLPCFLYRLYCNSQYSSFNSLLLLLSRYTSTYATTRIF